MSGFNGTLLTIGSYAITGQKYIVEKSYDVTVNSQDLDSYRDANGFLVRNSLAHQPIKIEFQTKPDLSNDEWWSFWSSIRAQFTNATERKVSVTAFVPELNDYVTQYCYIPDPKIKINHIYNNKVYYDSVRIALIGY